MNSYMIIDIETYPDYGVVDRLPEPKISGVLKDPAKIEAAKLEAKEAQIAKMALSAETGRIACIGYYEQSAQVDLSGECAMLENFFDKIKGKNLVTFNGMAFDLPFIYKRAMILGVKPSLPLSLLTRRYTTDLHIDLMQIWSGWNSQSFVSLDYLSKMLLNNSKIDFDVTKISDLINTDGGMEKLKEYCSHDVELTAELFNKMKGWLF